MNIDLHEISESPAAFRSVVRIRSAHGEARLSDVIQPFQQARFADLDPALIAVASGGQPQCGRHWWEATKGASKDSDLALMILWLLAFTKRPLSVQVGAADQDQADELRKAAKSILGVNEWLAGVLNVQTTSIVCKRTDSTCEIVAADVAGSHGARPDVLILNELTHIEKQEFAENLADNASKVPWGVVIIATNAGVIDSWQWKWRELARTSDRWTFHKFDQPAPWLDPNEIEEARKRNSVSRFARLWLGQWVSNAGDALDDADIEAALTLTGPMRGWEAGFTFVGGLDLAVRRDHAGFVTLAADHVNQRVRVADLNEWAPLPGREIQLMEIREAVRKSRDTFGLGAVFYDPSQAELMAQELRREGLTMIPVSQTGKPAAAQATAILEAFRSHRIDLYKDPRLLRDLKKLRLIERSYGLRLEAVRDEHGHADIAKALSFALPETMQLSHLVWFDNNGAGFDIEVATV